MRVGSFLSLLLLLGLPIVTFLLTSVSCETLYVSRTRNCEPSVGKSGSAKSATVRVETWQKRFRNLEWSDPRRLSEKLFTVRKDAGVVMLDSNIKARLYGGQLCLAVRTVTKKEVTTGHFDRTLSCYRSCLGNEGRKTVTNLKDSGGPIVNSNPPCYFRERRTELRISTNFSTAEQLTTSPPPRLNCVSCYGRGCSRNNSVTKLCDIGDKCYTVRLQEKKLSNATLSKGCTSSLPYVDSSLDCDYKCKKDVNLLSLGMQGKGYHSVCVSCCSTDNCNLRDANSAYNVHVRFSNVVGLVAMWFFIVS